MHLLHTEWSHGWGGQEIRILSESIAFKAKGYKVTIAAHPDSQLFKNALSAEINTQPIKFHKGLDLKSILELRRFIKNNKVTIVHSHSSVDARIAGIAAHLASIPMVRSRHLSDPIKRSPFSWLTYMYLARHVITSGASIRQAMIDHNRMIARKITSIPAGIDTEQFHITGPSEALMHSLQIHEGDFVVGIVAVLRSWKGHDYLIHAIKDLESSIPNIKLLIIGEGPSRARIESLIAKLDLTEKVTLTGYQKNPAPYISLMNIAVLPSFRGEATSQALPQAMSMGKPVIATNVGGLPEVVLHMKTGLIVEPKSAKSIADAILYLFHNPEITKNLAEGGRNHVLANFTFKQMIDKTESVYKSLLAP